MEHHATGRGCPTYTNTDADLPSLIWVKYAQAHDFTDIVIRRPIQ